jgi:hypothetical protein
MDTDITKVVRVPQLWARRARHEWCFDAQHLDVKNTQLPGFARRDCLSSTVVGFTLAASACMHAPTAEEPPAAAPTAPTTAGASRAPTTTTEPSGVAWTSNAQTTQVPERQGKRLILPRGERCKTFRNLPSLSYSQNTLVEDACLRIPSDTVIEVKNGVTLAIVATSGLSVGKNVTFDAKGARGHRGDRAAYASVRYSPGSDAEIQALCVDHGNRCACPLVEPSMTMVRGRPGASGLPGGNVRVITEELVSPTQLAGFAIDVSGGAGGPPGDSGTQECWRGPFRCSSVACSAGATSGGRGPDGRIFVALAGTVHPTAVERVKSALGSSATNDALLVGKGVMVADQLAALDDEAIQKGWQRRAGEETF